jgi:hypothetical protein
MCKHFETVPLEIRKTPAAKRRHVKPGTEVPGG